MKFAFMLVLAVVAVALFVCVVYTKFCKTEPAVPPASGADHLVSVVERELVKIYGQRVLSQRPWIITERDDRYVVEGTFHGGKGACGGVAKIEIEKGTYKVLSRIHGK